MYHLHLLHISLIYVLPFPCRTKCQSQKVFMNNLALHFGTSFLPSLSLRYNQNIWIISIKCHNIELGMLISKFCPWEVAAACGWKSQTLVKEILALSLKIKCLKCAYFEISKNPSLFFLPEKWTVSSLPSLEQWLLNGLQELSHSCMPAQGPLFSLDLDNYNYWWSLKDLS